MKIIVDDSIRLDKFMFNKLKISRNQIENFIKNIGVKIDGKEVFKSGLKLKNGQILEFEFMEVKRDKADIEGIENLNIEIIYEDDDILVVNKPSGLVVHPAPSVKEITLVDWLKFKNISLSTISGEERHGIVHRIDKQTTGALVIAKNNEAHKKLSAQLEDKTMGRYYLAIINPILKNNLIVEKPISRNPNNRLKMAVLDKGRRAKTEFIKISTSTDEKFQLIGAKLWTGRTHQIRVHLEYLNRVILGDNLYGFKAKIAKIERVMLHAYILYLTHPTTLKRVQFKAKIFDDFNEILDKKFNRGEIDEKINKNSFINEFNINC